MDTLRRRLPLQARRDGREQAEGLVDARLQVLELPEGAGIGAGFFPGEEGVHFPLEGLVGLGVGCQVVEQTGQGGCCGVTGAALVLISLVCVCVRTYVVVEMRRQAACLPPGHDDEAAIAVEVLSLLPRGLRVLVEVTQDPGEDIGHWRLVLKGIFVSALS